jgi:hypothetical protein
MQLFGLPGADDGDVCCKGQKQAGEGS